jgi:hypothetical protein
MAEGQLAKLAALAGTSRRRRSCEIFMISVAETQIRHSATEIMETLPSRGAAGT